MRAASYPGSREFRPRSQQVIAVLRDIRRPVIAELGAGYGRLGYALLAAYHADTGSSIFHQPC